MKDFLQKITREAGDLTKTYFGKTKSRQKDGWFDVVTQADEAANKMLVEAIKKAYPEHGIISEEKDEDVQTQAEYVWTIDPIDGTSNFSRGIPLYSTMVALMQNRQPIMSAIYDPIHDEFIFAQKGKGAFMNGKKIQCSTQDKWEESMGVSSPRWRTITNNAYTEMMEQGQQRGIFWCNLFEGMGNKVIYVSTGRIDWDISPGGLIWDFAPSVLILQESGCKVTTFSGQPWSIEDDNIIAANPTLYPELLKLVQK